jgi:hypothetical protein
MVELGFRVVGGQRSGGARGGLGVVVPPKPQAASEWAGCAKRRRRRGWQEAKLGVGEGRGEKEEEEMGHVAGR